MALRRATGPLTALLLVKYALSAFAQVLVDRVEASVKGLGQGLCGAI